jgi:hypothetical protein
MALNLKSLVLRGVLVLVGEKAVGLRLDFSYAARAQNPEVPFSMRPGSCARPEPQPEQWNIDAKAVDASASRAGRSDSFAGVLTSTTPTTTVGGTTLTAWSRIPGRALVAGARIDRHTIVPPAMGKHSPVQRRRVVAVSGGFARLQGSVPVWGQGS